MENPINEKAVRNGRIKYMLQVITKFNEVAYLTNYPVSPVALPIPNCGVTDASDDSIYQDKDMKYLCINRTLAYTTFSVETIKELRRKWLQKDVKDVNVIEVRETTIFEYKILPSPSINIFKNAKIGDSFSTKSGRLVKYHGMDTEHNHHYILIPEVQFIYRVDNEGVVCCSKSDNGSRSLDIVR